MLTTIGNAKYNPTLSDIIPIPAPSISISELISTSFKSERDANSGVIVIFTNSLNDGLWRSMSAIAGENE